MRLGLVLALAIACGTSVAERYEDPKVGFSMEIPEGWQPMTTEEMNHMQRALRSMGEKSEYVAGFKADAGVLQPPYLLVQWLPNSIYGIQGQMTEAEIQETVDAFEQGVAQSVAKSALERQGLDVSLHQPRSDFNFDMAQKRFIYSMALDIQGTQICYLGLMQFGREGAVQPLYYEKTLDALGEGSLGRQTVMSIELTPAAAWSDAAPAGTRESPSSNRMARVVRSGLIGALIGGLIGLVVWLLKKRA